MLRALSTRRSGSSQAAAGGYERIVDDSATTSLLDANNYKLSRSRTTTTKISPAGGGRIFNLQSSKSPAAHEFIGSSEETKFRRSKTTNNYHMHPPISPVITTLDDHLSNSPIPESNNEMKAVAKEVKKASKVHPLFSLIFEKSRRKKATAKPEFSRYIQYLKEGGVWDMNSAKPVIYS